jgi:TolB-like protein
MISGDPLPRANPGVAAPPDPELVRQQLKHIVASDQFAAPARSRKFLQYIVEETLAGRGERIKAFAIATEVFGRNESFDAQGDPIVRIEASRLRRALEHYYALAGRDDPVRILVPKGGYQPIFEWAAAPVEDASERLLGHDAHGGTMPSRRHRLPLLVVSAGIGLGLLLGMLAWLAPWPRPAADSTAGSVPQTAPFRPSVLVLPFVDLASADNPGLLARGIGGQIVAELTRFREITVIGRTSIAKAPPEVDLRQLGATFSAAYVLEGSVAAADDRVRVVTRLHRTTDAATLWSQTYDHTLETRGIFALQDEIAAVVVSRIAQPQGPIARSIQPPATRWRPDDLEAYRCVLEFYAYRTSFTRAGHARVTACLEKTVALYPDYATAWAMLALVAIDRDRFGFADAKQAGLALEQALIAARRATSLDPGDVRGWQALMMAHYLRSEVAAGREAGERGLALNPNDTELVGELGMRLALSGEWERGTAMIRSVLQLDPGNAPIHWSVLALDAFRQGRYEEAMRNLDRGDATEVWTSDAIRSAALGKLGRLEEAKLAGERFLAARPGFFGRLEREFGKRNLPLEVRRALLDGWRRAGLPVPGSPPPAEPTPVRGISG